MYTMDFLSEINNLILSYLILLHYVYYGHYCYYNYMIRDKHLFLT